MSAPRDGMSAADGAADAGDDWNRTSPLGIVALAVKGLRQAVLPVVAIMFGSRAADSGPLIAVLLGALIIGLSIAGGALAWWKTRFRIGTSDIRLEKGVLARQARSVPFERIQDVSLEQGLVPRLLGLVELRFETGAGGKDELHLAYVGEAEGEALRETVRARLDGAAAIGQIAGAENPVHSTRADEPLFAMGLSRLLLFGVFEFSLVVFAALAGAAQQFDFLLPFDVWDAGDWRDRLAGSDGDVGHWLEGLGWAARIVGIVAALIGLGLVGLATGLVRTVARDYGFRLDRTAKGLRRRRGLVTRTDVSMPVHHVQALTVSTGLLRRIWGWHGLALISLAQDAGSANHTVAPFARMSEIARIAHCAGFALPGAATRWHRPSPRYRTDRVVLWMLVPLAALLAALLLGPDRGVGLAVALAALLFGIIMAARQFLLWRFERHALSDGQVLARHGWLAPRLKIAAQMKLHSVEIVRGPLAQRRGYADLRFGLAGGRLSFRGMPIHQARAMRAAVLTSIAAVDFSELPR